MMSIEGNEKVWPVVNRSTQRIIELESGSFKTAGLEYLILKDQRTAKEYLVLLGFKSGISVTEVLSSYEVTED